MSQSINKAHVTKPAPDFHGEAVMADGSFGPLSLSQYKGKYVVLFFYPLAFTFVCPTEIIAFSDRAADFAAANCEVIGASVDSHFANLAWTQTPRKSGGLGKLNIPLLCDLKQTISRDYGVLLEDAGHTLRGTFIIDAHGVLRHASFNDPPVGRSVDEVLRLVKGYQYADVHGEVCPAGWNPGAATIKPNPKDKLEYFEKANK